MEKDEGLRPKPDSQPEPGSALAHPEREKIVSFPKPQGGQPEDIDLPAKVAEEYIKKHGSAPRTRFDDPPLRRLIRSLRSFLGQR